MYPQGDTFRVTENAISTKWCGAHRPGHFSGVLTIVLKLLSITRPTRAYFGEKDYQQLLLVEALVKEFFLPTQIVPCPTLREADGLAMSSRNVRLSPAERAKAPILYQVISSSLSDSDCMAELQKHGFRPEYVETFEFRSKSSSRKRRLAAAWLGKVRLIDNVELSNSSQDHFSQLDLSFAKRD
jgi:pantoate--beta-alanine ligase